MLHVAFLFDIVLCKQEAVNTAEIAEEFACFVCFFCLQQVGDDMNGLTG